MASEVDICNLSLSHLGVSDEIASLDEASEEAQACNRFYEQTRDEVLRDYPWSFATRLEDLALVEEEPNTEWGYSYRYPVDALKLLKVQNQLSRIETDALRVKTRIIGDDAGRLILLDLADPVIEYTARVEDTGLFPPDFVQALSAKLAFYIAPRVTGGDEHKLGDRAGALYKFLIVQAQANDANEQGPDLPPDSDFISAREGYP